jgi:Zn-dependent protease
MLPIPPLDGSKILVAVLPYSAQQKYRQFAVWVESYGLFAMFAFIFIFVQLIATPFFNVVGTIVSFLTGVR